MPQSPDQRTIESVAAGDEAALAELYETCFDAMFAEARRATRGDEATCLDVVQDAMLRVIRRRQLPRESDHFDAWLRVLVRSCAHDRLRAELRRRRREARYASRHTPPGAARPDDRLAWIQQQLDALEPTLAAMVVGRFKQGFTLRQLGESLGLSSSAVDGRINRALGRMRAASEEPPDE